MFDVFYLDRPTGLFAHERWARDLEHARSQSRTRFCWVLDYLSDYQGFDFLWEPPPWQAHQAHTWPSQHQASGGTWLLPRLAHTDINRDHPVVPRRGSMPRLHIRHCADSDQLGDVSTRYIESYLGTLRRALRKVDWQYCWVTSDVCDYTDFDFSWHPSEWQQDLVHVWASNEQKFGDTFYLHVPTFLQRSESIQVLEHFPGLDFLANGVPRHPVPRIYYDADSVTTAIQAHEFVTPVVQFYRHKASNVDPAICLWQERRKTVTPLNRSHSTVLVPREAKSHITTQVYDYPWLIRDHATQPEPALDVVFISNGEPRAEEFYQQLVRSVQSRGYPNHIHWVRDVTGRVAAYHAAARASTTPWFFAVFAKLWASEEFDWSWQPDYLQAPKHYIFHAANAANGLEYGHQAMIAYNRELVLNNPGLGLDFTLDSPHCVVPRLSGRAICTTDWQAWRTAFREVLKLRHSLPDIDSEFRISKWTVPNQRHIDLYGEDWSALGAQDAMEYYDEVSGDFDALRRSYDWAWLASYAWVRRGLLPDR